ncbi:hypothetical protein GCM10010531_39470 [Blastococcus jejuensis]|uniref:Copper resistance protein D domain-containing protein n=1 Tax=Blastococcus jejuensis TaxID=351224 RepID=A0ABP6PN42_9ACTN
MTVLDRPPIAPDREDADDVRRPIPGVTVALSLAGLLVVLSVALAVGAGGPASGGALVDRVLPVSRLVGRIAALGTVGALLFAAVLRPSAAPLPAGSRGALRAASVWATAWAAATAVAALLTLSQLVGPGAITPAVLWTFVSGLPAGRAALVVLAVSVLVAALARRSRSPVGAGALLVLAAAGVVVPAVLTGHSAEADHHLLAVTGLGLHVLAASLWVGGLLALLVHGRGRDDLAPAATRFSAVALACFVATGTSGVLAAWLILDDLGPSAVLASGYGWLLAAKTAALTLLGVIGWWHRRRTLPRLRAGRPGSFRRFAAVEAGVMLATVALAVALSASPPPADGSGSAPPAAATAPAPASPGVEDMSGHDHGDLSVTVLVDETRFHVSAPVDAGSRVTVHNATATEVTITAQDGSFDVVVPGHALMTFPAPDQPGAYRFTSRHSSSFTGVLVVR